MITRKIGRAMSSQLDRVNEFNSIQRLADMEEENRALREQIATLREQLAAYEDQSVGAFRETPAAKQRTGTLHNNRPVATWSQLAKKLHYSYHQCRRYTLASGGWEHAIINGTYFVYVDQPLNPITKQKARRKN